MDVIDLYDDNNNEVAKKLIFLFLILNLIYICINIRSL